MRTEIIIERVKGILNDIIESNVDSFRREGSFKVRPGYGYDKFYLDWVEGSYDMSLQGLIHYILYDEGIYKKILNTSQYDDLSKVVNNHPESIYGPDDEDKDYEDIQEILDSVYWESITFVEKKLTELGFNVKESFSEYLN